MRCVLSAVLLVVLLPATSGAQLANSKVLGVKLIGQETEMWCWAASGQMVMDFLGKSVSQCDQANNRFSRYDCCMKPTPAPCIRGGWPEFGKYGFSFKLTSNSPLTWSQLKQEVDSGRPVAFSWHWNAGSGHMMVAVGYRETGALRLVRIHDPLPVNQGSAQWITYERYVEGPYYTHWDDFYDIQ